MGIPYGSAIEEIKARANIVDFIGSLINLKRAGSTYKACCPFHAEKTPSFVVYEASQLYVCFGCGEKGDIFNFVQKYYNLSFPEAVEKLAAQYGVVIDSYSSESSQKRESCYEINRTAARFFYKAFTEKANPGYTYMRRRGLEAPTLQAFGIGYADSSWQSLLNHMKAAGFKEEQLKEMSLISEKGGRFYDKFRGRVMFPIFNTKGKVIGFGGRMIGDGEPKYLNSSESFVFKKGSNLYGLNLSKSDIQKEGMVILVEGYMDVVSLYQAGVRNVAASLGTALTDEQARLLKRYCSKVLICYDSDQAGIKAALRGIDVLRKAGLEVRVLNIDDGKDPDDYIKKHGCDAFLALIRDKSVSDVDYKISLLKKKYDLNKIDEGVRFLKGAAYVLRGLSPVEADLYIKKVASENRISEGALRREVENGRTQRNARRASRQEKTPAAETEPQPDGAGEMLEKTLLRLCLLNSEYFIALSDYPEAFSSPVSSRISKALSDMYRPGKDFNEVALREALDEEAYAFLADVAANIVPGEDDAAAFADCTAKLDEARRQRRMEKIQQLLKLGESGEDKYDMTLLMKELIELQKQQKK